MKVLLLIALALAGTMLSRPDAYTASTARKTAAAVPARGRSVAAPEDEILALRLRLIARKKAAREQLHSSMSLQDENIRLQSADYETKKELYENNLISKSDLENSERIPASTRQNTERMAEWIAENDRALALAVEAAEQERNNHSRSAPIRYDGAADWSLLAVAQIGAFFRQRFGRPLPVSAAGQSETHDRLGLDHRDAVDVALRPDSVEGRDLIAYLRRNGVPFTAFRGKLSGMSTGAHIHIGRPSPRLPQSREQSERIAASGAEVRQTGSGGDLG
jgi:hypothetical protein